jgi:4-hydroxybenzoate polyprenyltransferase
MIMAWLGAKGLLGLAKGYWLLIAAAAAVALYFGAQMVLNKLVDSSKDAGATEQREADLTQTVNNVEKANAAAETVRRDPDAARAECLRNARNKANC